MTHGHSQRPVMHGGTVWQLYEWQQRQQYRYGSPTAPVYNPAPDYSTAVSSSRVNSDVARSISVPPTLADIPPPGPPGPRLLSPRRPHTPAERVTVKPLEDRSTVEVPPSHSPHRLRSYKVSKRQEQPPCWSITSQSTVVVFTRKSVGLWRILRLHNATTLYYSKVWVGKIFSI